MQFCRLSNSGLVSAEEQRGVGTTRPSSVALQSHDLVEAVSFGERDDLGDVRREAWSCEDVGNDQEDVLVAEDWQDVPHGLGRSFFAEHGVANVVQLFGNHLSGTNAASNDQNAAIGSLVPVKCVKKL